MLRFEIPTPCAFVPRRFYILKPVPMLQTEFDEGYGAFSPDGHWIAYCSFESGRYEVYVRSFTESGAAVKAGKWPVSTAGGVWPQWRRDGKELFFTALDGKLMAVPVKAGPTFEAGVPVTLVNYPTSHWSAVVR